MYEPGTSMLPASHVLSTPDVELHCDDSGRGTGRQVRQWSELTGGEVTMPILREAPIVTSLAGSRRTAEAPS